MSGWKIKTAENTEHSAFALDGYMVRYSTWHEFLKIIKKVRR